MKTESNGSSHDFTSVFRKAREKLADTALLALDRRHHSDDQM
jgi:hypothetical protein